MKLIDTHAHLDHLEDIEGALSRSKEYGVDTVIAVSEDLSSSQKNWEIAQTFMDLSIHVAMGMHPSEANTDALPALGDLIDAHKDSLVAIGEVGLDFWYQWVRKDEEKKKTQRDVFQFFLDKSRELDLPVVIHSRGAWKECLKMVQETKVHKALFHWYSGPVDILEQIFDSGYLISGTPSLQYSPEARAAMKMAPVDRVLIETDTPVYYRNRETNEGFQAEPRHVFKTLEFYCQITGQDPESAAERLNRNAKDFFNL